MQRVSVQSSSIATIGYEHTTEILEIEFVRGPIYQYKNVPQVVYEALMNAPSHGIYLNTEIKGDYPYEQIA